MKCNVCQVEIPEGQDFCPECGESIFEAIVMSSEDVKKTEEKGIIKPKVNKSATKNNDFHKGITVSSNLSELLKNDKTSAFGLIGAILIIISPFFTWIWQRQVENKISVSLFMNTKLMGFDSFQMKLYGIVIIILGAILILLIVGEFIPLINKYSKSILWKKLILMVGVVLLIAILKNKEFHSAYEKIMNDVNRLKEAKVLDPKLSGGLGAGVYLMSAGILLYGIYAFKDIFHLLKGFFSKN